MQNIRCVSYKDEFSANNCAYNDLQIGAENKVVGCGSKVFGASKPDDLVIITAVKDNKRYAIIGKLSEKLESCDKWELNGGHTWNYNWSYIPLTNIFHYDTTIKNEVKKVCDMYSLNINMIFNSRFCSKKLKPAIDMLINKFGLTI